MPDNFAGITRRIDEWKGNRRLPRFADPDIKPVVERMRMVFPAPLPGSVERLVAIVLPVGQAFAEGHIHYDFDRVMYFPNPSASGINIGGEMRDGRVVGARSHAITRGQMLYIGRAEYYEIPVIRDAQDLRILSLSRGIPGKHDNRNYL